jgi:acyl carrier protein
VVVHWSAHWRRPATSPLHACQSCIDKSIIILHQTDGLYRSPVWYPAHSMAQKSVPFQSVKDKKRPEIEDTIRRILITELEVDPAIVSNSDSTTPLLGHGIGLDSMEALTLAMGLEAELDIEIADDELTAEIFENIGTLAEYLLRKTSG